jgi:uncharacterized peroxidase-related enzyme
MGPEQGKKIAEMESVGPQAARGSLARPLPVRSARARAWAAGSTVALLTGALLGAASHGSLSHHRLAAAAPAAPDLTVPAHGPRPVFILFQSGSSSVERQFLARLRVGSPIRDDLRVVLLDGLTSPTARRFGIRETPTLLVLGPDQREISRRTGAPAISAALAARPPARPAATASPMTVSCRVWRGPRLRWVEESDPRARRVYRRLGGGRRSVPAIFKALSLRPDLMEKTLDLSEIGHFSDGYLDRRTKERIATYVSALNGSHYCTGSHAGGLRDLGARPAEVAALARGDLDAAALSPKDRALFTFIRKLTLRPGDLSDADVARLRQTGWHDEQIFEAAFDASLFAYFNRLATTYGLDYPADGWRPSEPTLATARRPTP